MKPPTKQEIEAVAEAFHREVPWPCDTPDECRESTKTAIMALDRVRAGK